MNAIGEEKALLPGQLREFSMEKNVARSIGQASTVVIGKFKLPGGHPSLRASSNDRAFLSVEFHVDSVIKGNKSLKDQVIKLQMDIFALDEKEKALTRKIAADELQAAKDMSQKLEKMLEEKLIDRKAYREKVEKARKTLIRSDEYLTQYMLVPLRVGDLDTPYRDASSLVTFGMSYALMLFSKKLSYDDTHPLFENQLDIYPASDSRVVRLLNAK